MSNNTPLNQPAFPCESELHGKPHKGLTARQYACIHLCVPESGDPELDELIRKAQRRNVAAQRFSAGSTVGESVRYADYLLNQLAAGQRNDENEKV